MTETRHSQQIETSSPRFSLTEFNGSYKVWNTYGAQIRKLIDIVEEPLTPSLELSLVHTTISHALKLDTTFGVFLSANESIVGFSYGKPLSADTVQFGWTMIHPQYRGKGGWSRMMDRMDAAAKEKRFTHMRRLVRTANAYADKVYRRYGEESIETVREFNDVYGPHKEYIIRIP